MNRIPRPRWTIGTMALVIAWFSVVLWLNISPHIDYAYYQMKPVRIRYGFPWNCAFRYVEDDRPATDFYVDDLCYPFPYLRFIGNAVTGIVAIVVLTYISRYLLRHRFRLPREAIVTFPIALAWASVVFWLNITPNYTMPLQHADGCFRAEVYYGFPVSYVEANHYYDGRNPQSPTLPIDYVDRDAMMVDVALGILAVSALTWGSRKFWLRRLGGRPTAA